MTLRKKALITGARRGIGFGIARELAARGYDLVINGISSNKEGEKAAKVLRKEGSKVLYVKADISLASDSNLLLKEAKRFLHDIDIHINNAGIAPRKRIDILQEDEKEFDRVLNVNLKGPYLLTQMIALWMIEIRKQSPEKTPMIINISSISSYTSSPSRGQYCISKAGISMMTKLYADRLAEEGINVYEIVPGIIETGMTNKVKLKYDKLIEDGLTPIKRWGKPEDIGKAVLAIAEGHFPFSTGEVINVDGGFHLYRL